ncbi:MAG: sialidase family protein [Ignavibacteria bacterium]
MFDKSTNGGITFGTDKNIAQGTPPDIPISSSGVTFPSIAADITNGPNSGNVYVAFCDSRNGDPDVFLTRSTNRGVNWSAPVRVNNDPVGNGKLQCWPWIAVDENGNIAITFLIPEILLPILL